MIIHGILSGMGVFVSLIHEMYEISEFDVQKNYKINWDETKVYDNSNRGRMK